MTNKQFVKSVFPSARCSFTRRINMNPYYLVHAKKQDGISFGIAFDFVSPKAAWRTAAEKLRDDFKFKLES